MTALALVVDSGPGCNNRCFICPRPPVAGAPTAFAPLPELPAPGDTAQARTPVVIHGGEPTLHPELEAFLARCKAAGRPVLLETNARALAAGDRAQALARAGLTHAILTLHGASEASHDFLTRTPGSFRQTIAGAMRLRAAGVRLVARVLITRSCLAELPQLVAVALGLGPVEVRFAWARMDVPPGGPLPFVRGATSVTGKPDGELRVHPTPMGDPARFDVAREWLVPRYPLGSAALASAVAAVSRARRPVVLEGVPACHAPPGVPLVHPAVLADSGSRACAAPSPPQGEYAPPCEPCPARHRCPGIPSGYLARFGPGEFAPPGEVRI